MKTKFKIGDIVKLKNDDGRLHKIKEIIWKDGIVSEYATVIFEDNNASGFISLESNWSDIIIVEPNLEDIEIWKQE